VSETPPRWLEDQEAGVIATWLLAMGPTLVVEGDRVELRPELPVPLVVAELLRAAIWSLSGGGTTAVHVTRLLSACLPAAALVLPATAAALADTALDVPVDVDEIVEGPPGHGPPASERTAMLRAVLEDLELIGDIAHIGHGWRVPAPCRVVAVRSGLSLLLGAPPMAQLPSVVRTAVVSGSLARVVALPPDVVAAAMGKVPVQADEDWRRSPPGDLVAWATAVVNGARMLPGNIDQAALDLYAPALASGRGLTAPRHAQRTPTQYYRWLPLDRRMADGRHVARLRTARGRSVSIVELRRGAVVSTGLPVLYPGDLRRLYYGLDLREGSPTVVRVSVDEPRAIVRFTCASSLPGAELRLAVALGALAPVPEGTYYPQHWDLPVMHAATFAAALSALGVALVPTSDIASYASLDGLLRHFTAGLA
jgi:hypothetical protein